MAAITIMISLPSGTRYLTANSERSAERFAEDVIYSLSREALPVALSVTCADDGGRNRLVTYLVELQIECMVTQSADESRSLPWG